MPTPLKPCPSAGPRLPLEMASRGIYLWPSSECGCGFPYPAHSDKAEDGGGAVTGDTSEVDQPILMLAPALVKPRLTLKETPLHRPSRTSGPGCDGVVAFAKSLHPPISPSELGLPHLRGRRREYNPQRPQGLHLTTAGRPYSFCLPNLKHA